jgi:hypothetical protein
MTDNIHKLFNNNMSFLIILLKPAASQTSPIRSAKSGLPKLLILIGDEHFDKVGHGKLFQSGRIAA